jgi:hypothetical protein
VRHRSFVVAGLVALAGFLIAGGPAAHATTPSPVGAWGKAIEAPGTSSAYGAEVAAVSCAPRGQCTALVDTGLTTTKGPASYVVTEHGGIWGTKVAIPGLTKIAPAGLTLATGLSCPKSGYCLVTGIYAYGAGNNSTGGFTIWESNGKWGTPAKIGGLTKLTTAGLALTTQVACSSTTSCVVSGIYGTGSSTSPNISTFIAEELNGTWKPAIQVPGLPKPSSSESITPSALSCPSVGNCVLSMSDFQGGASAGVGSGPTPPPTAAFRAALRLTGRNLLRSLARIRPFTATAATPTQQARAAIEAGGTWKAAQKVGPAVATPGVVSISALACPAAGKCVLAGFGFAGTQTSPTFFSFAVTQSGTTWSQPVKFTGMLTYTLACPAAGSCVAGGTDAKGVAAIAAQKSGKWGAPRELPGATALSYKTSKAQDSEVDYLACPSVGNCSVGGSYYWNESSSSPDSEMFVGGEANGTWAPARVPAGIAALNAGLNAGFSDLSCASAASCAAGGGYTDHSGNPGAFLIAETPAP